MHQHLPVFIILPGKHDHKLVPADPVNRAVGKDIADHLAGLADVFVSGLVPLRVVDFLQSVHVAYGDGEFRQRPPAQLFVQRLFRLKESLPALDAGQPVRIGLPVHLRDLRFQFRLHRVNLFFQIVNGSAPAAVLPLCGLPASLRRVLPHLVHQRAAQLVQLPLKGSDFFPVPRNDDVYDAPADQQGKHRHDDRGPGQGGQLPVVPFRAEVHADDPRHLVFGVENRGIRAVEGTPRVLIAFPVGGGGTLAGFEQSVRVYNRGSELARIVRRIQPENKRSVSLVPYAVDVFQIDVVLEVEQRPHDGFVPFRPRVRRGNGLQHVAVDHRRRRVRNIQHPGLHQVNDGGCGLAHQKIAEGHVDRQQKNNHQHQVL